MASHRPTSALPDTDSLPLTSRNRRSADRTHPRRARLQGVAAPTGFEWTQRKNGDVVISHHGQVATVLRGHKADAFISEIAEADAQQLMAKVTGNYRRGNERRARQHPRNHRA